MSDPILVPQPRHMNALAGDPFTLPQTGRLMQATDVPNAVAFLQTFLQARGFTYTDDADDPAMTITLKVDANLQAQGYTLSTAPDAIHIVSGDAAGVFYGVCTLRQLIVNSTTLPRLDISDHPDFLERGYMLDISRDRVPKLANLLGLIDDLATLKFNQLQLYTEHTFAYDGHEIVWRDASPFTREDIATIQAYCQARHITLVPNQNSLGHMERWLQHDGYRHLAESPDGFADWDGKHRSPSTLNPLDPASLNLMRDLYDQLLPLFDTDVVNVGCDEPWELGQGKSGQAVAEHGGRVYLNWLLKLRDLVTARGKQMHFWGDIIINHPDLLPDIPDDVTLLEWGYEGNHPFDERCRLYAEAGVTFYVCPGTSSWNALIGRVDNARDNLLSAARAGLEHGAVGYLITDWGDYGHWQPPTISIPPLVYGAGVAWYTDGNADLDLAAALDTLIFHDSAQIIGDVLVTLGNLYQRVGPDHINGQILTYVLQTSPEDFKTRLDKLTAWGGAKPDVSPATLRAVIAAIDTQLARLPEAQMTHPAADQIRAEITHAAQMLRHGAAYAALLLQGAPPAPVADLLSEWDALRDEQRRLWLAVSRPGGLDDSLARFDVLLTAYQDRL